MSMDWSCASDSETCELCCGLRGHARLQNALFDELAAECAAAEEEYARLRTLFTDACWYNFETRCRFWRPPWHPSWPGSEIALHTYRFDRSPTHSTRPFWFWGQIKDAPPLPPEIILKELNDAQEYLAYMRDAKFAPFDYAPGGQKYEALMREGEGVRLFTELKLSNAQEKRRVSDARKCAKQRARRGERRGLVDAPAEAAPSPSAQLLGGVRGDGHVVPEEAD